MCIPSLGVSVSHCVCYDFGLHCDRWYRVAGVHAGVTPSVSFVAIVLLRGVFDLFLKAYVGANHGVLLCLSET